MRTRSLAGLTVLFLSFAGCQTINEEYDRPARIIDPTPASRAALQDVMNRAIGTDVVLAADAFTARSVLVIENNPPPTMEDPVPMGRVMEPPMRFRLVTDGSNCIVIDERDRSRYLLLATDCVED